MPPSYSTFRDIQLLTPPESVKDLQNLLHIWFNNKKHSSNQREKALTSFAKEKRQHERQSGDVTCWFCGKKGHRKSQCKDRLERIRQLDQESEYAPPPRRTNARLTRRKQTNSASKASENRMRRHYAITACEVVENRADLEPKKPERKKSFRTASLCAKNICDWRNISSHLTQNTPRIIMERCSEIPDTKDSEIERKVGKQKPRNRNWNEIESASHACGAATYSNIDPGTR